MMTLLKYDFRRSWNTPAGRAGRLDYCSIRSDDIFVVWCHCKCAWYHGIRRSRCSRLCEDDKTYAANIRSYNRRLIPVTGLSHVLSPIILVQFADWACC